MEISVSNRLCAYTVNHETHLLDKRRKAQESHEITIPCNAELIYCIYLFILFFSELHKRADSFYIIKSIKAEV